MAALTSLLAVLGLLLTTVGVYGVIAARTVRRTREVGIRIALGATRGQVLRLVHGDGVRVAMAGIAIGAPLALGVAAQMGSMLFAIAPRDWLTLGLSATILAAAVSAATLIPAWRATRVQPGTALRDS
jgi:ABC-type antimicrobial peptide transport system permease subunit